VLCHTRNIAEQLPTGLDIGVHPSDETRKP
jgi:hypothetical protein